jgi:hypothetical protein
VPGGLSSIIPENELTGTTGPRPIVKRPGENNPLFRQISADMSLSRPEAAVQAVYEAMRSESAADGARKTNKKEIAARYMQQYNVDEATALRAVEQWNRSRTKRN